MKKFWFQVIGLVIIIGLATALSFNKIDLLNTGLVGGPVGNMVRQVKVVDAQVNPSDQTAVAKALINVEIADTPDKRNLGLGGRDLLASDSGMLFLFDSPSQRVFWMKGMRIPLDFIWISGTKVVDLLPNVPPPAVNQDDNSLPRYSSTVPADKVLEVNSGYIQSKGIKIGDQVLEVQ